MRNGINRALQWIKKVFEITEVATVPTQVLPEVRAMVEVFGWERLPEGTTVVQVGGAAANQVVTAVVPADICRLVLEASVVSSDVAIRQTLWIAHRGVIGTGADVAVGLPFDQAIAFAGTPGVANRAICMQPGERLVGRCVPAPGVGEELTMTFRHIDLPIGEYVPPI